MPRITLIVAEHESQSKEWAGKKGLVRWRHIRTADYMRGFTSKTSKIVWLDSWVRRSDAYELVDVAKHTLRA